jgi:hypothetical protein
MFDGLDQLLDFVKLSRFAVSTANRVTTAQITGAGAAGDDSTAETVDACEVVQPLGLMAYPTLGASTEALIARLGDRPVVLAMIDKGRAAQAVEAGEVRLYGPGSSNAAAVIRIRADGSIEVSSLNNTNVTVTASGTGEVRVNGSAVKIAADTDPVDLGAWTFVPGTGGASLTYTPPGGAPTPITTATAVAGKIAVTAARRAKTSA